jgi:4-amino-4-deoxy-L-arabinose transferase-like glycosyltransferase
VTRRSAYPALALVCAAPRLGVLLHERTAIVTSGNNEKSDIFAQVFVQHGTFGFIPGEPSAYTQPLYGWFLIPVYWIFGRSWQSVGISQLALALVTVFLIYEIGRRVLGQRAGVLAAAIATLNPYLAWHDMHVNREIVDQVCAAAVVLLTLLVAERPTVGRAVLLGVANGLAMLGNTRLVALPVVCLLYLVWRLPRTRATALAAAVVLAGAGIAVAPWLVRNRAELGCWAITTDGRALWKANNPQTYGLLSSGQWIDSVRFPGPRPPYPGRLTPDEAHGIWARTNGTHRPDVDECLEMSWYTQRATSWAEDHPGRKLKLAALSEQLLWQPNVIETTGSPGAGTHLDVGRRVVEPTYMGIVYALAFVGLFVAPRVFVVLALLLFAYQSVCAALFVGATRYRIAWDFLLALLAAAALRLLARRLDPRLRRAR